jgi:deoxycytidylate deaminase
MKPYRLAKVAAMKGEHRQYKVGCCIIKAGRVLSVGFNKNKTHPVMGPLKHLHAEVDAVLNVKDKSKWQLRGATAYITRCNPSGKIGMARPCLICRNYLSYYGITNIYYTDKEGVLQHEIIMGVRG